MAKAGKRHRDEEAEKKKKKSKITDFRIWDPDLLEKCCETRYSQLVFAWIIFVLFKHIPTSFSFSTNAGAPRKLRSFHIDLEWINDQ